MIEYEYTIWDCLAVGGPLFLMFLAGLVFACFLEWTDERRERKKNQKNNNG